MIKGVVQELLSIRDSSGRAVEECGYQVDRNMGKFQGTAIYLMVNSKCHLSSSWRLHSLGDRS